ncbi:MAG TPA: cupin domain-containing protein [Victivallales bacterium]|nr:cupin domain-containing protein [Victivallales bacterium]
MDNSKINIKEKFEKFNDFWSPRIIAQMNDYHFKVAKFNGEFVWHKHDETDEVFIVIDGKMTIKLRNETILLETGEMFVVPKGIEHKPTTENECKVLLIEPKGTVNTGDSENELTKAELNWI